MIAQLVRIRIAAKLEADVALRREGVIDPHLDSICDESTRSIESHLSDYEAKMKAAGRKAKTIASTITFIRAISDTARWTTIGGISADAVNHYARTLKDQGRSAQTIKNHLSAIKSFTKWLANDHKLPRDPLISVTKPNAKTDRRRERRMLLPDEWDWLRSTTLNGPDRYDVAGAERVLLYATAIQTGLRSNELRSLSRGRLFLDTAKPYIICKARSTKNQQDARQYVQPDLAEQIREHVNMKAPQASVFAMPSEWYMADMLRADLAEARHDWIESAKHDPDEYERRSQADFLAEVNHEGEHLDFHSLRHTCGAWLAMTGAHPKEVQSVMRHSTITLTMDTYGHLFPGQEAETVARFPNMVGNAAEARRATGTTDADAGKHPQQIPQQSSANRPPFDFLDRRLAEPARAGQGWHPGHGEGNQWQVNGLLRAVR